MIGPVLRSAETDAQQTCGHRGTGGSLPLAGLEVPSGPGSVLQATFTTFLAKAMTRMPLAC